MSEQAQSSSGRNPLNWPDYDGRGAVHWQFAELAGQRHVACSWDFATYGGTVGEVDADTFVEAVHAAIDDRLPFVSRVRTGGTRLQEGMAALVGIPRCVLALDDLARAALPHVSVVGNPTTGGVWVGVCSVADVRVAERGATIGFSGPRVVEAMTGEPLPPGSHTAESAYSAGLVDAVVDDIDDWLGTTLRTLSAGRGWSRGRTVDDIAPPTRDGLSQVESARNGDRQHGIDLLHELLDGVVELRGADDSVAAVIGRLDDNPVVGVAMAARRGTRPTVAGYELLVRAATLADTLRWPLLALVDTPGADPTAPSERAGIARAIANGMAAVLNCTAPTLAVVHGEGGSGGALAAATCDVVLMTELSYFTALGPEGAAAALKTTREDAADRMALTPGALIELGFADGMAPSGGPALKESAATWLASADAAADRLAHRRARWSAALPGSL